MKKIDEKKKKRLQIAFALVLLILITIFFSNSKSELLEDHAEVAPRTQLTYYLDVTYDGVDRNGIQSDDTTTSKINSGTIFVEDKIPDGLDFIGFVTTANGTIGAVQRSDESIECAGKVVDDTKEEGVSSGVWNDTNTEYTYHGLHYNAETRVVSFKVKYLQAGCKLTVGVITKTPLIDDPDTPIEETRRDFYNYSTTRERTLNTQSNTVHVFMGKSNAVLQNVSYEYTGEIPEGAPELPETASYAPGSSVGVAGNATMEGYTFSGWETEDATITNNSFYMPNEDVVLRGSFIRISDYKVTYSIAGTAPEDYVVPQEERYYPNTVVELDTLSEGDIINGYRFLGWESTDVEITEENDFTMPARDITLTGSFEEERYQVSYEFNDYTAPPNSYELLPATQSFKPGEKVTLENVTNEPSGYEFLGWYEDDEFEMPNEDVVILGEWKASRGVLQLQLSTHTTQDEYYYYNYGEKIVFSLEVYNPYSFAVNDVMIKENLDHLLIVTSNSNVTKISDHIFKIGTIAPESSVIFQLKYIVTRNDRKEIINEAEIIGATSSEEGYELPETPITSDEVFDIKPSIKVCVVTGGSYNQNNFQIEIGTSSIRSMYTTALKSGECKVLYINPSPGSGYRIREIVPQEYELETIRVTKGSETTEISNGSAFSIFSYDDEPTFTFVNRFKGIGFYHSTSRVENKIGHDLE